MSSQVLRNDEERSGSIPSNRTRYTLNNILHHQPSGTPMHSTRTAPITSNRIPLQVPPNLIHSLSIPFRVPDDRKPFKCMAKPDNELCKARLACGDGADVGSDAGVALPGEEGEEAGPVGYDTEFHACLEEIRRRFLEVQAVSARHHWARDKLEALLLLKG
jgi:hypothetical protein